MTVYCLMALCIVLMVPYKLIDTGASFATAMKQGEEGGRGEGWQLARGPACAVARRKAASSSIRGHLLRGCYWSEGSRRARAPASKRCGGWQDSTGHTAVG